jgi:hypothetical protein
MAGDAVLRVKPLETTPARDQEDIPGVVMEIIRADRGPRGISVEEVIGTAATRGVSQGEVLAAIEFLITEDECYQPQKGYVKPL